MLSEIERNKFFDRKKKEVLDRLLGSSNKYPIPSPVTRCYVSQSTTKNWYECPRILNNTHLNSEEQKYLTWLNYERRINNGRIVTVIDKPVGDVVPPPVK